MGATIPKDVQAAFYRVVHDFGVEKLAGMMGISPGVLYNKANVNETGGHHKATLADCIVVTHLTGDKRIVQAFAHAVGGVFYALPDLSQLSTGTLLLHILKIGREYGDVHSVIHDVLSNDEEISPIAYKTIEHETHELIAALLEGLARMREMSRG